MNGRLKTLLERAESWPEKAQDEAIASLEAIEDAFVGPEQFGAEDLAAFRRSAEDVKHGRFASEAEVQELFDRHRGR